MPLPAGAVLAYDTRLWTEGDPTLANLGSAGAPYDLTITTDLAYDNAYGTQANDYYGYLDTRSAGIDWVDFGGTPAVGGVFTFIFATGAIADGAGYANIQFNATTEAISPAVVNYDGTMAGPEAVVDFADPALFVAPGLLDTYNSPGAVNDTVYFIEVDLSAGTPYVEIRETEASVSSDTRAAYGGGVIDGIYDPGDGVVFTLVGADTGWPTGAPWRMRGMAMVRGVLSTSDRAEWVAYFSGGAPMVTGPPDRYTAPVATPRLGVASDVQVWVLDRTLRRRLRPVRFTQTEFARVLDDASQADIDVAYDAQSALAGLRPWQHGIGIWINGEKEWSGPVVNFRRPSGDPSVLTIMARDRLAWMSRRRVHQKIEGNTDLGWFFQQLVLEGTRRDNRFGLQVPLVVTGASGDRSYLPNSGTDILSALQELGRSGLDFTMRRDDVLVGPTNGLGTRRITTDVSGFMGLVGAELDGLSQGNSQVVAGGGSGGVAGYSIIEDFEEWDDIEGLLEHFTTEENIRTSADALSLAEQRWEKFHNAPLVVTFPPLSPQFAANPDELHPGITVRLQADDDVFDLARDYRVTEVRFKAAVDADGSMSSSWTLEMEVS